MKKIFCSRNRAELEMLQGILRATGISCLIRNDYVTPAFCIPFAPELWVLNDDEYLKARDFCERWQQPALDCLPYWTCSNCGAGTEDQFNSCWKCGTNRHAEGIKE